MDALSIDSAYITLKGIEQFYTDDRKHKLIQRLLEDTWLDL